MRGALLVRTRAATSFSAFARAGWTRRDTFKLMPCGESLRVAALFGLGGLAQTCEDNMPNAFNLISLVQEVP